MTKYTALQIANYLIDYSIKNPNKLAYLIPLKLQKSLYYAQGWYLANTGEALFEDEIEAWPMGPVIPEIYRHFHHNKARGIKRPTDNTDSQLVQCNNEIVQFIEKLVDIYGKVPAFKLVETTHFEDPWLKNYGNVDKLIPIQEIKEYFSKKLGLEKPQ